MLKGVKINKVCMLDKYRSCGFAGKIKILSNRKLVICTLTKNLVHKLLYLYLALQLIFHFNCTCYIHSLLSRWSWDHTHSNEEKVLIFSVIFSRVVVPHLPVRLLSSCWMSFSYSAYNSFVSQPHRLESNATRPKIRAKEDNNLSKLLRLITYWKWHYTILTIWLWANIYEKLLISISLYSKWLTV